MRWTDLKHDAWHGGQLLAFSALDGPTDAFGGLTARTVSAPTALDIVLPAGARLVFPDARGPFTVGGDAFELGAGPDRTRGAFLDAHHLLVRGPCRVDHADGGLHTLQRGPLTLVGAAPHFDPQRIETDPDDALAARTRWLRGVQAPSGLPARSRRTLAKALSIMKTQVYTPEGIIRHRWTTPDRWPHRWMWLWDSAFHAIGWRHIDPALARDMLSAVFDVQQPDGRVPIHARPDGVADKTQPPVLAMAAEKVFESGPDSDWLEDLYPRLAAYVRWDLAHRDTNGNGLPEWKIEGDPHCRSGESGMDNSPRFDRAARLDAVDFSALLASECEALARIARSLRKRKEADAWSAEHERIRAAINRLMWSEEQAFYLDVDVETGRRSPVLASSGFLPLVCGAPDREQATRLIAHLRDPAMFGTPLPVASVAAADTEHYSKDMWRGPVWMNVNWLIAAGLDRYGRQDLACEIRAKSIREIEKHALLYGTCFEFFDDRREVDPPQLLRKGRCAPDISPYHQAFFDYGWTATCYTDWVYTADDDDDDASA